MNEYEQLDLLSEIVALIIFGAIIFGICTWVGNIHHNSHEKVDKINGYVILK